MRTTNSRASDRARGWLFSAVVAGGLLLSGGAFANDIALAEKLFQDGLKAMEAKDYMRACKAFSGSNEADPSPGTLMNLAACEEKQGKVASAWGSYQTAAGMADQRGQKERVVTAREAAAKLEPQLHKLVVAFKGVPPDDAVVTRNGVAIPKGAIGTDIPVDPGEHAIEVTAKGKKRWVGRIVAKAGPGTDRIDVPELEDEVAPPGPGIAPPPPGGEVTVGPDRGRTQRILGGVVTGTGVAVGATALVFQIVALSVDKKATEICALPESEDVGRASCNSKKSAAKGNQAAAIGLGIGGVLAIGVGLTLIFTAPSGPAKAARLRVVPDVGPQGGGLVFSGAF
jgi:hypothetical protein